MPLDDILREVSADNAWESILHITDEIPSRLAGSENARRMAEFAHQKLSDAGLDARLHEFMGLVSFPEPATITVLAPETFTIDGFTLAQSASTDGLEGGPDLYRRRSRGRLRRSRHARQDRRHGLPLCSGAA